ncbi:hypothetical protein ACFL59_03210, partial [Planctomycetota bacterium]
SYYQWGGLPTEVGMLFFLALVWTCLSRRSRRDLGLGVLLFGGIVLVHHLSALIGAVVVAFYVAVGLVRRRLDSLARDLLTVLALTFIAYSFFIVPYLQKITELGGTSALRFYDESMTTPIMAVVSLGYDSTVLGLLGLWLALRSGRPRQRFLLSWFTSLLAAFLLLDYVYRGAALLLFGESFTAFTPSRFLTVLSYPLAIYAGHAMRTLHALAARRATRHGRSKPSGTVLELVLAGMLALVVIRGAFQTAPLVGRRAFPPEAGALITWIRQDTPPNAFIINVALADLDPVTKWLPYLTWRPTTYTPIPASENRMALRAKEQLFRRRPPDLEQVRSWLSNRGLRGYVLHRPKRNGPLVLSELK